MKQYTLITGASGGIGKELALIAAREKNNIILVARNGSRLHDLAKELASTGILIETFICDLTKSDGPQAIWNFCHTNKITVDTLINNAGSGDYGSFAKSDRSRQLAMIDLNIRSLTELTHLFLPDMLKKKHGRIMNLGSVASFLPGPMMSVYFSSKNYVLRFSEALSEELRGSGVSVTCLCPGPTKTDFGKGAKVSTSHSTANPTTTAREVAEFGWYALQNGQTVAVYGLKNRLSVFVATRLLPRKLLAKLVKRMQR